MYVLYSMSFSVPLCRRPMWGSDFLTSSPSSSRIKRNTPWAAGCCGPKLRITFWPRWDVVCFSALLTKLNKKKVKRKKPWRISLFSRKVTVSGDLFPFGVLFADKQDILLGLFVLGGLTIISWVRLLLRLEGSALLTNVRWLQQIFGCTSTDIS